MGSKVFTNRLFENNPIPAIWTINDAKLLDESIIRRMALAIEMPIPPAKTRERVWHRVLAKNTLSLPETDIKVLSQLDISPAVVDNAARVAKQIGGRIEDFQFATQGIVKAISGHLPKPKPVQATPFCPELIRTDTNLERITRQLKLTGRKDFSLCLYGPPGTGKSAFVRHLAETLELPVVMKRASDLLGAYVGNTEKSIAKAFQEALDKEAFLIFDEADSLLGDRRYAVRNWEVSQVNEMLTWMENHPLPFACTTNLMDRLDQAPLRRFTFKCHFDFLGEEQLRLAFERFFGVTVTPGQVTGMSADPRRLRPGRQKSPHHRLRNRPERPD
jgi:AAA+ superfamily predicted ATPase